jgi:hypothetical protein
LFGACFSQWEWVYLINEKWKAEIDFINLVPPDATDITYTCPYCEKSGASLAGLPGGDVLDSISNSLRDYFTPPIELLENFTGALRAGSPFFVQL